MKRLLIVSPHFPPINAPDHQRVRMSLRHYTQLGWQPTVLAVDPEYVEGVRDLRLLTSVPPDVEVRRVTAVPSRVSRRIGIGNLAYRAWFSLLREGRRLLGGEEYDLVYFSTTQFVCTALGRRWRREFNVPFVVDVQDPWLQEGVPVRGGLKAQFARWQARRMEERSWRDAAGFIAVSPHYIEMLQRRYAWFRNRPSAVIPFGVSEDDFAMVRANTNIPGAFTRQEGVLHVVNVGAISPAMLRSIELFCAGLARLRNDAPELAARIHAYFIGTSYAPGDTGIPVVKPIADAHHVNDLVTESPARIPYFEAIQTMLRADVLFVPGSMEAGYTPSKLAACFIANKPVLAAVVAGSAAETNARALGVDAIADLNSAESTAAVAGFLRRQLEVPTSVRRSHPRMIEPFTARALAHQQCDLFTAALQFAK